MKKITIFKWGIFPLLVLSSFGIGYFMGQETKHKEAVTAKQGIKWYCSMDPQIVREGPGECPICGMALVPMPDNLTDTGPRELALSKNAAKLAEITTAKVVRKWVSKEIRLVGKVDYDETRLAYITSWVSGRIDNLYVDYTGVSVKKGDHMVSLYSPELLTAQEELIRALQYFQNATTDTSKEMAKSTLEATREKLRLWGLGPEQIKEIENQRDPLDHLTIYAQKGGIVVEKNALQGMYVSVGTKIYTIADLSEVWVRLDAYESDISWLRYGQEVKFSTESYPGENFQGRITFIDPMLKEATRTIKIRVNVPNLEEKLKPGMFVRAIVHSALSRGGQAMSEEFMGYWICPMHHDQVSEKKVDCNICGMSMVPTREVYPIVSRSKIPPLVIPATAPLITGTRAVVYVKVKDRENQQIYEGRQIVLGPKAGLEYIVLAGLKEGEEVVVQGNFKIDSSLQIMTKVSMMSDDEALPIVQLEVPEKFLKAFTSVYQNYFQLQMFLAQDKEDSARNTLKLFDQSFELVSVDELSTIAKKEWSEQLALLQKYLKEGKETQNIQELRTVFEKISQRVIFLEKRFGHLGKPYFLTFCPMAFQDKGAFWLQDQDSTVWNSYFGEEMLHCGVVKEKFSSLLDFQKIKIDSAFQKQIQDLMLHYISIQEALALDQLEETKNAFLKFQQYVLQIDGNKSLDLESQKYWLEIDTSLKETLGKANNSQDIDSSRQVFASISEILRNLLDTFELEKNPSFYLYKCDMAFDAKGAIWIQVQKEKANPYYGQEMPKCGKLLKTYP